MADMHAPDAQPHGEMRTGEPSTRLPIVTVSPTIMDGTVVRWFSSEHWLPTCQPQMSASRRCVRIEVADIRTSAERDAFVADVDTAMEVQGLILNGQDVRDLATHDRDGFGGPWLKLNRPPASGSSPEGGAT